MTNESNEHQIGATPLVLLDSLWHNKKPVKKRLRPSTVGPAWMISGQHWHLDIFDWAGLPASNPDQLLSLLYIE